MALLDFLKSNKQAEKATKLEQQIVSLQNEVDSLKKEKAELKSQIHVFEEKIEKKEEDLDYLDYRLRDTENRLNLAVCELNNQLRGGKGPRYIYNMEGESE